MIRNVFILLILITTSLHSQSDSTNTTRKKGVDNITDQVIAQDVKVFGKLGYGIDMPNNYSFGSNTSIEIENNLRLKIEDTSSPVFPGNDWMFEFNSNSDGGDNYFKVVDLTSNSNPFHIGTGYGKYIFNLQSGTGFLGINSSNPTSRLHIASNDTPTLSFSNASTIFDLMFNEDRMEIRNRTNDKRIVFIDEDTPSSTLHIKSNGYVGIGKTDPQERLDVNGSIGVSSYNYIYFGKENVDDSWRISERSGDLVFQKRVNGVWVERFAIEN
jgi:hypothetical protein